MADQGFDAPPADMEIDEEQGEQMRNDIKVLRNKVADMREDYAKSILPTGTVIAEVMQPISNYVSGMIGRPLEWYEQGDIAQIFEKIVDKYVKNKDCLDEEHLKETILSNIYPRGGKRKTRKIKKAKKVRKTHKKTKKTRKTKKAKKVKKTKKVKKVKKTKKVKKH